jgi:putative CocE/NonD family hydrolase
LAFSFLGKQLLLVNCVLNNYMNYVMRIPFLLVLLGLTYTANSQNYALDSAYVRDNFIKSEHLVPMRDGVRLFTTVYAPRDKRVAVPFLLNRTPYSCSPYGKEAYRTGFQNMELARQGYIYVFQDVRGRYMSEGTFMDVRPFNPNKVGKQVVDEASDTYDTVEWLLKNVEGNNGRVGAYGISYPGFYATMTALSGHPAVRAVSPQAPVTDWFMGDDFHHNGAFCLMDAFFFHYARGFGFPRPKPVTTHGWAFNDFGTPDNYDFYLKVGALRNFKERFIRDTVPFWNDLIAHPNYDAFWKARNPRPHLKQISPAVLTVGGLFDAEDCYGAWKTYEAIERQNDLSHPNRIVMGPWVHGGWARTPGNRLGYVNFVENTTDFFKRNIELPFFEFFLKDKGDMNLPEAYVFQTGENRWKRWNQWPPAGMKPTPYYFQEGGSLSEVKPAVALGFDEYMSDPANPVPYTEHIHLNRTREYMCDDQRFASRRPDVLVYETPVLKQSLELDGPVVASIFFSSSGSDADFVVKLVDVYPDTLTLVEQGKPMGGYQMLVRGEVMRARYRESFEDPQDIDQGVIYQVKFELPDVAHTFLPGHKLQIQLQSSWFPLIDRNPQQFINIYEASDRDFIKANHRIYRSGRNTSAVILPVYR